MEFGWIRKEPERIRDIPKISKMRRNTKRIRKNSTSFEKKIREYEKTKKRLKILENLKEFKRFPEKEFERIPISKRIRKGTQRIRNNPKISKIRWNINRIRGNSTKFWEDPKKFQRKRKNRENTKKWEDTKKSEKIWENLGESEKICKKKIAQALGRSKRIRKNPKKYQKIRKNRNNTKNMKGFKKLRKKSEKIWENSKESERI